MYSNRMGWAEKVENYFKLSRNSTTIKFVPKSPNPSNFLSFGKILSENFSSASDLESWDWECLDISLNKPLIWKSGHLDVSQNKPEIWKSEHLDVSLNKPYTPQSSISGPAEEEQSLVKRTQDVWINPSDIPSSDNIESPEHVLEESIKIEMEELPYPFEVKSELNVIKCGICSDEFIAKVDLTKHRRVVHPIPKDILDDSVTENLALTPNGRVFTVYEHTVYLTASGKFKCPADLCKKACTKGKVLRGHMRREHGNIYFRGFYYSSTKN